MSKVAVDQEPLESLRFQADRLRKLVRIHPYSIPVAVRYDLERISESLIEVLDDIAVRSTFTPMGLSGYAPKGLSGYLRCQLCGLVVAARFRYASRCPAWPSVRQAADKLGDEFHDWAQA